MNISKEELNVIIPSETVRQFVIDTNYQFDDWDLAAMVYHMSGPIEQRYPLLRKLRDATQDDALRKQITDYLNRETEAWKLFKENPDHKFIYTVKYPDLEDWIYREVDVSGFFFDYEAALKFGLSDSDKDPFEIEKHKIWDIHDLESEHLSSGPVGEARFYKDGKLTFFYDDEIEDFDENDITLFMNRFYEVPNPFERGDIVIVKEADGEIYGIVEESQQEWKDFIAEYKLGGERQEFGNPRMVFLHIMIPDDVFEPFNYGEFDPICLERYQPELNSDRSPLDEVLLCTSKIYKGEGSLWMLGHLTKEFNESKKGKDV